MPDTLRAFIAVSVPAMVRTFIASVEDRLERFEMNVRWVRPGNVHLTLNFLGEIDAGLVPAVSEQMERVALGTAPFSLSVKGAGVFPDLRRARVLWVGLDGDLGPLAQLKTRLDTSLSSIGFQAERRPFRPHLTIGRPRRRLPAEIAGRALADIGGNASDTFPVDGIELVQSTLKPTGAVYSLLHTAQFKG